MERKFKTLSAIARVKEENVFPELHGTVSFRQTPSGVIVTARIFGLPTDAAYGSGIFAFHIHDGDTCEGNGKTPFPGSGGHYNPRGVPHPYHAGDMPPLFAGNGYAYMSFLTDRFTVSEVVGKVVIIHSKPDDFKTQPSGDSGEKIACGKIARGF